MLARHVHTLARPQFAVVLHFGNKPVSFLAYNLHVQFSVVKEHIITHVHIFYKVGIRNIHHIVRGVDIRVSANGNLLSCLEHYRLFRIRTAHLRSLCVYKYAYMPWHLASVGYNRPYTLRRGVRGVYSYHVYTCQEQLAYKVHATPAVAYRSYNLCLFHWEILVLNNLLTSYYLQMYKTYSIKANLGGEDRRLYC